MKNNYFQDLNLINIIKSLSQGKCVGCVFNKIGTCSLLPIHQIDSLDLLSDKDVMSDKFSCKYKILQQDLSDFFVDEYIYVHGSDKPLCLTELNLFCKKINNYKEKKNNENI